MYTPHCAPHAVHPTLCTPRCAPYIVHPILCTPHCTPHIVHSSSYALCTAHRVHYTPLIVCTMHPSVGALGTPHRMHSLCTPHCVHFARLGRRSELPLVGSPVQPQEEHHHALAIPYGRRNALRYDPLVWVLYPGQTPLLLEATGVMHYGSHGTNISCHRKSLRRTSTALKSSW